MFHDMAIITCIIFTDLQAILNERLLSLGIPVDQLFFLNTVKYFKLFARDIRNTLHHQTDV